METLQNLPWYTYAILGAFVLAYIVRHFWSAYSKPVDVKAKFRKSTEDALTGDKLFSISLDAVITEWWQVNTNTLRFKNDQKFNQEHFNNYLSGWGINTAEGYWSLTNYFMEDGRRWYFDFIHNMVKNEPKEKWNELMANKFGGNQRADKYLAKLSSGEALNLLKNRGFFTFDSELDLGVAAYDVATLVGQARRAYTANIISEQEAWRVIDFATQLARENFTSWEDFGKSYILGFALDLYSAKDDFSEEMLDTYKQVVEKPESPWNTIPW